MGGVNNGIKDQVQICPNCGKVVAQSDKFISLFNIANEIKQPDLFEQEVYFQVTSFSEELNDSQ